MAHRQGRIPVGPTSLFYREIGEGRPLVVLHGGPAFDHQYLAPELDRLAGRFRVVYYDARGRGWSSEGVTPEEVTIESEVDDIASVLETLDLQDVVLLGHSWGCLLAVEYLVRDGRRVSHLVLMNTAPVSHHDYQHFVEHRRAMHSLEDRQKMAELAATPEYLRGQPEGAIPLLRISFGLTLPQPDLLDSLVDRMAGHHTRDTWLKAREIASNLVGTTQGVPDYDRMGQLAHLEVPTLVIHGEHDFVPFEIAESIAGAIPGGRMTVVEGCGHLAYMEVPDLVTSTIADFVLDLQAPPERISG
jgi:proline iminopeptidase